MTDGRRGRHKHEGRDGDDGATPLHRGGPRPDARRRQPVRDHWGGAACDAAAEYGAPGGSAILSGLLFRAQEAGYGRYFAAPTGVVLPTGDSGEPDLLFIHRDRLHIIAPDKVRGVPGLVIEILSPNNLENDLIRKYRAYERAGVPLYWVVDPAARAVQPSTLREGSYEAEATLRAGDRLESPLFPGITLDVGRLFPG